MVTHTKILFLSQLNFLQELESIEIFDWDAFG